MTSSQRQLQSFEVTARSDTDPPTLFALLTDGSTWPRWAGPLIRYASCEREGTPAPWGVGAIRQLGSKRFHSREETVEYDPPHHMAYVMLSGQPVRGYRSDVDLTPDGEGTLIRWRSSFEPLVPGTGPALRRMMQTMVGGFAKRLAQQR